jgi:hypothetical protein
MSNVVAQILNENRKSTGGTMRKTSNGVVPVSPEQNGLFAINANYKLFIYGVWVSTEDPRTGKVTRRFKHGEHIDDNLDGVIKYIVKKYFAGKASEFDREKHLIGIIDMTDHAISLDPLYDPRLNKLLDGNRKGHYDKELIPGLEEVGFKHIRGKKAKGEFGRSFELFEPPKDMSAKEVKDRFNTYHENLKKPTLDTRDPVIYDARDFVEDSKTKIEETYINEVLEDRHVVAGAPGSGKETGGLALIQIIHDLYGFDDTLINIFSCTIPKNLAEPISELARVDGYRFKDGTVADFSRFKCYMTNRLYKGLKPELEGDAQSWVRDNVQFIDSADEIPSKHSKGIIPLLFAGYSDLAYAGKKTIREKYRGLVGRVGTFAINEAHQFLKLQNKMYTALSSNLGWKFLMPLTGTPYNLILGEKGLLTFGKEQRSFLSRQQMMVDKKNNPDSSYAEYPDILTYAPSGLDKVKEEMSQDPRWKDDANGMTMQKLTATYDKETDTFKYFDFVHRLVSRLLCVDNFGEYDGMSIHNLPDLCEEAKNNLIGFLPQGHIKGAGVEVYIPALVRQLSASGAFGSYKPYVSYTDDLSDIKTDAKDSKVKTIVLTHRKHATGTNVPSWGTSLMFMPMGNSLTFYEQGPEGRIGRKSDKKTNCAVVHLEADNTMALKVQIEEKLSIERGEKKTFSEIVNETHDCYPYYNDVNGKLVRVNREDYGKMLEEMSKRGNYDLGFCVTRTNIGGIDESFNNTNATVTDKVKLSDNDNKDAKTQSRKKTNEQLELDFGVTDEDKKEEYLHNMKKQMIARFRKLLIIYRDQVDPTLESCHDFLVEAIDNKNTKITKVMGRCINYIHLLDNVNAPIHFDVEYTKRWLGKVDEIKDVDTALEYLRDKALVDNKTQFIPAHSELILEIVDLILKYKKIHKNSRIIDPCGGRGAFLIYLMSEAKKRNIDIDPKKVYYNDIDPVSVDIFKALNKDYKLGIPDKNISCKDALQLEYNMKKFDVVLTNPPYKDSENDSTYTNLWSQIYVKMFDLLEKDGIMGAVKPKTWATPKMPGRTSDNGKVLDIIKNHAVYINLDECKRHFTEGSTFSYSVVTKNPSIKTQIRTLTEDFETNPKTFCDNIIVDINPISLSIFEKFKKLSFRKGLDESLNGNFVKALITDEEHNDINKDEYKYPVRYAMSTVKWSKIPHKLQYAKKVIFPNQTASNYPLYDDGISAPANRGRTYLVDSELEGNNIVEFMKLNLMNFIISQQRFHHGLLNSMVIEQIPDIDYTKSWTEKDAYDLINLDPEEIDYIDANVE